MPQIIGALEPEFVTENESVKHCVARVATSPPSLGAPFKILIPPVVSVDVLGPVITKVLKSSLSYEGKKIK